MEGTDDRIKKSIPFPNSVLFACVVWAVGAAFFSYFLLHLSIGQALLRAAFLGPLPWISVAASKMPQIATHPGARAFVRLSLSVLIAVMAASYLLPIYCCRSGNYVRYISLGDNDLFLFAFVSWLVALGVSLTSYVRYSFVPFILAWGLHVVNFYFLFPPANLAGVSYTPIMWRDVLAFVSSFFGPLLILLFYLLAISHSLHKGTHTPGATLVNT